MLFAVSVHVPLSVLVTVSQLASTLDITPLPLPLKVSLSLPPPPSIVPVTLEPVTALNVSPRPENNSEPMIVPMLVMFMALPFDAIALVVWLPA